MVTPAIKRIKTTAAGSMPLRLGFAVRIFHPSLKHFAAERESKTRMARDPEIAALLGSGRHAEAFEMLVGAYQNKVFRLAYTMLGDRAAAEDAAQEAFLRIWKSLARYRGESALGTWIYSIARNACLTAISRRSARATLPLEEATAKAASSPPQPAWDALGFVVQLPEKQRQVVMLYYMEERSYEEVARLLDLPIGTVKTHLHRARKQLAIMMKEMNHAVRRV